MCEALWVIFVCHIVKMIFLLKSKIESCKSMNLICVDQLTFFGCAEYDEQKWYKTVDLILKQVIFIIPTEYNNFPENWNRLGQIIFSFRKKNKPWKRLVPSPTRLLALCDIKFALEDVAVLVYGKQYTLRRLYNSSAHGRAYAEKR